MKDGFDKIGQKIEDMRVEQAATNSSLKGAWREINASRVKLELVPENIEKAIHNHTRGCPINDVTEVGIKPERRRGGDRGRQETYDTPNGGTKRSHSITPKGKYSLRHMILIGVGVAAVIAALGIWIGVAMATGSPNQATHTIRDLKQQVVPSQIYQPDESKIIANP